MNAQGEWRLPVGGHQERQILFEVEAQIHDPGRPEKAGVEDLGDAPSRKRFRPQAKGAADLGRRRLGHEGPQQLVGALEQRPGGPAVRSPDDDAARRVGGRGVDPRRPQGSVVDPAGVAVDRVRNTGWRGAAVDSAS